MNRNSLRNRPTPTAPALHRADRVLGHLDVGQQLDLLAVERDGRLVAQPRQPAAFEVALALLEAVLGQDDRRRVDDHHAGIAVDDDPVVLAHQLAGAARADHRRNVHAARDDRGVRGASADVGDEAGEHALLELQHVGRRRGRARSAPAARRRVVGERIRSCCVVVGSAARLRRGGVGASTAAVPFMRCSMRSTTCSRSALRSRRYSSSISSNWRAMHLELRGQRPFGVVEAVGDPVLDAAGQRPRPAAASGARRATRRARAARPSGPSARRWPAACAVPRPRHCAPARTRSISVSTCSGLMK